MTAKLDTAPILIRDHIVWDLIFDLRRNSSSSLDLVLAFKPERARDAVFTKQDIRLDHLGCPHIVYRYTQEAEHVTTKLHAHELERCSVELAWRDGAELNEYVGVWTTVHHRKTIAGQIRDSRR